MRVVVAPDKFKGALDAGGVAAALADGVRTVAPDAACVLVPMADGGDGTVEAFLAGGATPVRVRVRGPLGDPVDATYARDGATAIIEMAAASGLALLGGRRDALGASTYGTGELLRHALDAGATRVLLGIGGSATTDGGAGALSALGARVDDGTIDLAGLDPRLAQVDLAIACDVDNPLLGRDGAAAVYGPQKGARARDVALLDARLTRLADAMSAATGRDLRAMPGAGAAGGLGWALASACGARLERGVQLVAEVRGLAAALDGASLVLTGEGRIDAQTLRGKVVDGVAAFARPHDVPVVAFGGSVDADAEAALRARGVVCMPIAAGPGTLDASVAQTAPLLARAAARAVALLAL